MIKLGVLTFEVQKKRDVTELIDYVTKADELNFSKFWLGEHFDSPSLWNNPEPLIPILLGLTENINIGAAGIILRVHSSFRVASNFKLMNALFPGRVDLGISNGHAPESATNKLLGISKSEASKIDVSAKIEEIISYYNEEGKHRKEGLFVTPSYLPAPNVWLLGSRIRGLEYATKIQANYSFSLMHNPKAVDIEADKIKRLKDVYFEKYGKLPLINAAFCGVHAETESAAKKIRDTSFLTSQFITANILGNRNKFEDTIYSYQEKFGIDEFVFLDLAPDVPQRIDNLDMLAEIFSLENQVVSPVVNID